MTVAGAAHSVNSTNMLCTQDRLLFSHIASQATTFLRVKQLFSYNPTPGLADSRAPANNQHIIPHFSRFWICMIVDHFEYFGDGDFVR